MPNKHRNVYAICVGALLLALMGAATANAETITATFSFQDGDSKPAPIRNAKVEIQRKRPNNLLWENALSGTTDAQGRFNAAVPFVGNGAEYSLRVYATNPAVVVYIKDNFLAHFYDKPGGPGPELTRRTASPGDTHNFDWNFADAFAAGHFNTADAMLRGLEYANGRRDPRETDSIATVAVQMSSAEASYYDPLVKISRLNWRYAMDDFTALHEYAHYLEERISGFTPIASNHNGCSATAGAVHLESPGHAWMEGFANYFARAVGLAFKTDVDGPGEGTLNVEIARCDGSTLPRTSVEMFVSAALLDLIDTTNERFDRFCANGNDIDRVIFQIFDRELDIGGNPTIQHFIDAWIARGHDLPPLTATFGGSGITVTSPRTLVHFDAAPAANLTVWRPGTAQWWVIGGASGTTPVWGEPGDVPVPADYDGDGLTDIAIWRPRDGNWWVMLSASGVAQTTQWGTNGDVPLPADYDGDGEVDFAVYRPSDSTFYFYSDNCGAHGAVKLGTGNDTPVTGDFDNDGSADFGLWNSQAGFLIRYAKGAATTSNLVADAAPALKGPIDVIRLRDPAGGRRLTTQQPTRAVIGDYDGDKRSDFAIWTPSTGIWKVQASTRGAFSQQWGQNGDVPVPADYDGDGKTDFAIWRPSTGDWWILAANGQQSTKQWGTSGDVPVPAR